MIFYRWIFTEIWITLSSNEVLGILDSGYLEDYFGTDGQITLRDENDNVYPVLMSELPLETPSIPHDVFTGFVELSNLPDGMYEIQGRVRDVQGNYTILGEVENPIGNERVLTLTFEIREGIASDIVLNFGIVRLMGGLSFETVFQSDVVMDVPFDTPTFTAAFMKDIVYDAELQVGFEGN